MNLPNKLTLFRVVLVPVMVIVYYIDSLKDIAIINDFNLCELLMVLLFVVASLTDFLDGYLARKYQLITTFGKFADPLADKLLVVAAMLILSDMNIIPVWIIIVIISREFIVSGIRLVVVETGTVIAASKLGKYKTATTMIAIIILFFAGITSVIFYVGLGLIYVACILTVISGFDYFMKNKAVLLKNM